jgi:hypothetical protein
VGTLPLSLARRPAHQRIGLDYVYREHVAWLRHVTIWVDRQGCAGDAQWIAAGQTSPPSSPDRHSLTGTTWETWIAADGPGRYNTFEFLEDNSLAYQDSAGARQTNAR